MAAPFVDTARITVRSGIAAVALDLKAHKAAVLR